MSVDLIKYAFVAGEVSPTLFGRSDLEKYDFGLAKALNWFIDYRGGLSTRPGTEFVGFVMDGAESATRLIRFQYAPNDANTYCIVFGDEYVRFIQDGGYILESAKTVTAMSPANPIVLTIAGHGWSNGDWVFLSIPDIPELDGRTVEIRGATTDTFNIRDPRDASFISGAGLAAFTSGTAARIYTIDSPYTAQDLTLLDASQRRDYIRLTHENHVPRSLVRNGHTDWEFVEEDFETLLDRPSGLVVTATDSGGAQVGFVVTAVFEDGAESLGSEMYVATGIVNYAGTAGSASVRWDAVEGARFYNVYRTNIQADTTSGAGISPAEFVGYIGRSYGPSFTDSNIIPDFTRSPPQHYNPFGNGRIEHIDVTAPGSGYTQSGATVSVAGGTGFVGKPIVNASGEIVAVKIFSGGTGYPSSAVVTFGGDGTGATGTAEVSEQSGNNPVTSARYDQRQLYAGTGNQPLTVFGSRPGQPDNFDQSDVLAPNDSLEHEVDADEVAPIVHMMQVRGGLVVMSQAGVWLMHGSEGVGTPITAADAFASLQSARGANRRAKPLFIDSDILYAEGKGSTVRLMSYSELAKGFEGRDMSILSNHLFDTNKAIDRWALAQNPHNFIVVVLDNETFLLFTLNKEQDVYAWCPCESKGLATDVVVVHEGGRDVAYMTFRRFINGQWVKMVERFTPREFDDVEDAWCVDAGLTNVPNTPAARLMATAITGDDVLFEADAAVFTADNVGDIIRVGGGKAEIVEFVDTQNVRVNILRDITHVIPSTATAVEATQGDWTMDTPFTRIDGAHHLEGETVQILLDGNVHPERTVVDGGFDLEVAGTRIIFGQGYDCVARTLPPTAGDAPIEHRRKSVVGLAVRVHDTRGLKIGDRLDNLYDAKERTDELYGEALRLQSGFQHTLVECNWDDAGQTYIVQDQPLPATVLGLVTALDVGDDAEYRDTANL